jgi:hypothetical protein
VQEWFVCKMLSNYYADSDIASVDSLCSVYKTDIKDPAYLKQLENARNKAIHKKSVRFSDAAKIGSKAPSFYLKDSANVLVTSQTLKGKWTLVSFCNFKNYTKADSVYAALKSIPSLQKANFQFLNIHMDSDVDTWKKILQKQPNIGTHLFCQGNWANVLTEKYGLEDFPFFIVIDPDGIIQYSKTYDYSGAFAILKNNLNK